VPILVYAMGVPVQTAAGTSLAIVGLNAAAGATDQWRRGRVLPRTGIAFGLSGLLGALAGVWANHQVRGEIVLILFSLVMVSAAAAMVRRPLAAAATVVDEHRDARGWLRIGLIGLAIGCLSGFFGVGGGFLIIPALVLAARLPMTYAVGTSLLAIAMNALWGLIGHLQFGGFVPELTALFVVGGLAGVLGGGHLAGRLPDQKLRRAFAFLILAIAAYTFARSVSALIAA
jgi:hypothetical protein